MTKKTRKKFTPQQRTQAVDDYTSGCKTAQQIAQELDTDVQNIYRWKTVQEEKAKGARIEELIGEGSSLAQAKRIFELEQENEQYKKKLAEQVLIVDLLKKLPGNEIYQSESELIGLIRTTSDLDRKRKRRKS